MARKKPDREKLEFKARSDRAELLTHATLAYLGLKDRPSRAEPDIWLSQVTGITNVVKKVLPEVIDSCLSDENKTAWEGYVSYLILLEDILTTLQLHEFQQPLRRLISAFQDAEAGVQDELFKVSRSIKDQKLSISYHVITGSACALIVSLCNHNGYTQETAAKQVAKLLKDKGFDWPRRTGKSSSEQWRRLLNLLYRVQRGDLDIAEDAIINFESRRTLQYEEIRTLMDFDLRKAGLIQNDSE
jgi:hypothetical protein